MAATVDFKIKRNANPQFEVLLRGVHNVRNKQSQPVLAIPLVNTAPTNTFIFRFFGQSEEITFDFSLFDDGTNVTGGTTSIASKTTVSEQIDYIKRIIFTHEFDTDWTFTDVVGLLFFPANSTISCAITNLEIPLNQGSNAVVIGTMTIQRGFTFT